MRRIKVVSEPTDLVPILRAFDSDVKRDVFRRLSEGAITAASIEQAHGAAGLEALHVFEKAKLVATEWANVAGKTEKVYQSYYSSFQIGFSASAQELTEVLAAALMPEDEFRKLEDDLLALVGPDGLSARGASEKLAVSLPRLRALLKRSSRLDLRGHVIVRTP